MIEALNHFALDSFVESFETMAFLSPMPAEEPYELPIDAVLLSVRFRGEDAGVVEMIASRNLGKVAASNMLGVESPSPMHQDDVLKEMLSVFGGLMLRRWSAPAGQKIHLSLPELRPLGDPAQWRAFIAAPSAKVIDVDGNLVALRVRSCE